MQGVAECLECESGVRSRAALDMWSVGCIFAELVLGAPLFESAETNFDLLSLHCDWLGFTFVSPDGYLEVRSAESVEGRPKLADLVPGLCEHGYDLLSRMLACDFRQRISADEASKHPFLTCTCEMESAFPKCCAQSLGGLQKVSASDAEDLHIDLEQPTPLLLPASVLNFESYPSFLHSGFSEGSQILPTFIQDLVEKRRLKRRRREEPYRDAAPAV